MSAAEPPGQPNKVHPKALEAIISAQYADMIGAPAGARARAQTAYTIASATASALVGVGIVADIRTFPAAVQVLGGAAR